MKKLIFRTRFHTSRRSTLRTRTTTTSHVRCKLFRGSHERWGQRVPIQWHYHQTGFYQVSSFFYIYIESTIWMQLLFMTFSRFFRKVYSILMLQLLITFGMVALFTLHAPTKEFAHRNIQLMYLALIVTFVLIIAMACCTSVRRQAPMNFVFLFVFTVAEAVLLGFISSMHREEYVSVQL